MITTMEELYKEIELKNPIWASFAIDFIKGKMIKFPENDLMDIAEPEKCLNGELWNFKNPNCDDCLDFGTFLFSAYKNREPMTFAFLLVDLYDHMKKHNIKHAVININKAFDELKEKLALIGEDVN